MVIAMEWESAGSWILMGVLLSGWFLYKVIRRNKEEQERKRGVPRGTSGWPLIGETLEFIASGYTSRPVSFMEKRKSLYGKVFKTHILGKAIIVSTDADVNKAILQNHGSVFTPAYPQSIIELLGESSILQVNGTIHKKLHGLIGSFLKSPQLKGRITRDIEDSVKQSLFSWRDKNNNVYLQDEVKKITFGVLVKALMSIGPGEDLNFLKREFEEFIKGLICLPIKLPGTRLYKSLEAKERLLKKVKAIVEDRKLSILMKTSERDMDIDAIDVLLRDEGDQSDENERRRTSDFISGNIIEMMIPGEETVPTAMTLAIKFLSDNPVALARVVEENVVLMRQKAHSCNEYTWTDYLSLPFTQNVINETLRLANIINAVWRKALKDVEIKGHLIPKGWTVLASFSSLHMDAENYKDPYEFDPWRWEKEGAAVNSNIFTPFGGGQRLCPGLELSRLEISIFIHHLVTTYRWVAEEDDIVYFPTVRMKRKLPITVTPLQH